MVYGSFWCSECYVPCVYVGVGGGASCDAHRDIFSELGKFLVAWGGKSLNKAFRLVSVGEASKLSFEKYIHFDMAVYTVEVE